MAANDKKYPCKHCTAIVLAAGRSCRLGSPKQLLQYKGGTLLQHTIDVVKRSSVSSIMVVLGSGMDSILNNIDTAGVTVIKNENWHTGIASSIVCGINALSELVPSNDAAILMVCDQPFMDEHLLNDLIETQKVTNKLIVASEYDDIVGTPALFHKNIFEELLKLNGDSGAKKIIQQHPDSVATVPFPKGSTDIDTLNDYESLIE